jgi:hypothetical protein
VASSRFVFGSRKKNQARSAPVKAPTPRARASTAEVGGRLGRPGERVEAVERLDAALDAPAHAADRMREPSELVLGLDPRDLDLVPASHAHGLGGLDQVAHRGRDPPRGPKDRAQDRREQESEEDRRLAAQLRDSPRDGPVRLCRDGGEAIRREALDEDPAGRRRGPRPPMDAPAKRWNRPPPPRARRRPAALGFVGS